MDYVGGVGARGPPSLAPTPSRSLSLRLKSHCSCELFSPLIRSLSYKMKKGYRVRVRTFVCVCMCVCARQEVAHRVRDHGSVPSKPGAGELGYRRASWNASARAGKVALGSETVFHFWFFFFLLFCLVSRRSLVLPTLSCRTSAPSLPLSSSCNVSRLSHFTPVPLSASSSLSLISGRIYFPRCRHRRCSVICDSPAMTDCTARLRPLSPDSAAVDR